MWSCATQRPFSGQRCLSENGLKFHCQILIFFWSTISVKVVWRCWTRLCQIVPFFLHTVISLWKWSRLPCQLFCALRRNMFLKTVWTFHFVCVYVFCRSKMSVSDQKYLWNWCIMHSRVCSVLLKCSFSKRSEVSLSVFIFSVQRCLSCVVQIKDVSLKTIWSFT